MAPTIPKLCGVKRSIFCTLVSVWAIIMLAAMGGLLSYKSLSFVEDLPVEEPDEANLAFDRGAQNCYFAVIMYVVTFVVSIYHWTVYHKRGIV